MKAEYGHFWFWLLLTAFLVQNALSLFRRWRGPSIGRLLTVNAAVLLFLLLGVLLVGEAWFYFIRDTTDGSTVLRASQRWMDRHVVYNDLGYRGTTPPAYVPRDPRTPRILVIGDSFAFGLGINREEDRFSDILQEKLRSSGIQATVYNVSAPGWNTQQETIALLKLLDEGRTFDVIVLAYVLNDHIQEYPPKIEAARRRARNPPAWASALTMRSLFLDYLWHRLNTFRDPDLQKYDDMMMQQDSDPAVWTKHVSELREIKVYAEDLGARLIVLTFPFVPLGPWQEYRYEEVHARWRQFWQEERVRHVDLLGDFRSHSFKELTVNRWDDHPNEYANELAANSLAIAVSEELAQMTRFLR